MPMLAFVGVGLLLVVLALPLMRRRVPPNGWYGVRVDATFADEWVWYEANARSGRDLLFLGMVQVALALLLGALAVSENVYAFANIALLLGGTILFAVVGVRRANRLLLRRRENKLDGSV